MTDMGQRVVSEMSGTNSPETQSAAYGPGDVLPNGTTLLVGRIDPRSDAADRLLDGITVALQEFDTPTLRAIADYRDTIHKDGWMQRLIREYVEVWR